MKRLIKKILFPFYNENQHIFLLKQWWFRTFIVLYVIILIFIPFKIYDASTDEYMYTCYESHEMYWGNNNYSLASKESLQDCLDERQGRILPDIIVALCITIVATVILYYIIQMLFFLVVINFIYLGSKK